MRYWLLLILSPQPKTKPTLPEYNTVSTILPEGSFLLMWVSGLQFPSPGSTRLQFTSIYWDFQVQNMGAGQVAQLVQVLAAGPDDLSSVAGTHMMERAQPSTSCSLTFTGYFVKHFLSLSLYLSLCMCMCPCLCVFLTKPVSEWINKILKVRNMAAKIKSGPRMRSGKLELISKFPRNLRNYHCAAWSGGGDHQNQ